ncbi:multicomponent Na+:H+ antiporter subunit A [Fontibacillus solani]|uniref:Multicomponent Na+:H+ antiporter subunit A n=1 Tax=Fontibacillus solani TaxID=1572857 RepID=A0A7W3SPH8_9BACL|nr:Na+/H+ antiporter subunit A [Fontibacillus solani]MBA9083850.1 multicomponent Na+:H+ antiporter subunit A [Fontibacillus solani]
MITLYIFIFLPFIFALFVPFLYKHLNRRAHTGWFVLLVPLSIFIYLVRYIPDVASGATFEYTLSWIPTFGINITSYIDGLGLLFGLLITGVGSLVIIYSIFYMSKVREALHNFYIYLLMFMGAMLGLVFSDHLLVLYGFWELTSVSSFLLIAYWYERKGSRQGALKAMLITVFGGFGMLAGFIMLIMMGDTYSIREIIANIDVIQGHALFIPALLCILLGAFTKSAQFPFGIWLPDAMEAPTPVSSYLHSATMVKAGIYLVARMTPVFGGSPVWFWLVAGIGLITLLYGSLTALRQTDLKALLAYSTISQLGLIMSLLGIGSLAVYFGPGESGTVFTVATFAALFHLFNHSTFKGSLFMVVGIIDHETGRRDIRYLGGLMQVMPITFTIALVGGLSMAGLPPFNGFLSKEMFFAAVNDVSQAGIFGLSKIGMLFPIIAWVASIFTFVYCMIFIFKTFGGVYRPEKLTRKVHEAPLGMLISPIILGLLVVFIFFFPNVLGKYILTPALTSILPMMPFTPYDVKISAWHGLNLELLMTFGVIAIGFILFKTAKRWIHILRSYPQGLMLNHWYNQGVSGTERLSASLTNRYMTGSLRHYLIYIFSFFVLLLLGSLLLFHGIQFDFSNNAAISVYDIGLVIAMIIASLTVLLASNRILAIVALGALGYMVSMFFVIFRAPDLALTQMVVETVTTVLFLLCFYHLPKLKKSIDRIPFKLTNLIISVAMGLTVTLLALAANGHKLFEPITAFFENAYELAGAKNIVNAILVDFRGFDTMLEISVLTIAGLGVYILVHQRSKRREQRETE